MKRGQNKAQQQYIQGFFKKKPCQRPVDLHYAFSRRFLSRATYIAIEVTVLHFISFLLSLGIEPMILALLVPCSTI